jgi:hypothetical protein
MKGAGEGVRRDRDAVGADGAHVGAVLDKDLEEAPVVGLRLERAVQHRVRRHVPRACARRTHLQKERGVSD